MTKIEWCDETINPIIGCSKISPGCDNCYAEKMAARLAHMGNRDYQDVTTAPNRGTNANNWFKNWNGQTVFRPSELEKPMHWKKPRKIFVTSMGDMFHESVPFEWVHQVWDMMKQCPQHTFMILTKRPAKMKEFVELIYAKESFGAALGFWSHVYLGVTAENQEQASIRIPMLLSIPAHTHFVSVEPMLGPVDLSPWLPHCLDYTSTAAGIRLDWVICGGESGPHARPMHPDWAWALAEQCSTGHDTGVPFFFKQWGEWAAWGHPDCNYLSQFDCDQIATKHKKTTMGCTLFYRVGKKRAGRLLGGTTWDEFPHYNL